MGERVAETVNEQRAADLPAETGVRGPRDRFCGLALIVVGAAFLLEGLTFGIGSMRYIGAGFMPVILSGILIVLGLSLTATSFRQISGFETFHLKSLISVLASIVVFALTIESLGIIPAVFLVVSVSAFSRDDMPVPNILLMSAVISVLCWAIFVVGLKIPVPSLRMPFG